MDDILVPALTFQNTIDILLKLLMEKYELNLTPTQQAELQQDLQWVLQGDSLLAGVASGRVGALSHQEVEGYYV